MYFRKKWISYILSTVAMVIFVIMAAQYAFLFGIDFLFSSKSSPLSFIGEIDNSYLDYVLLGWIVLFLGLSVLVWVIGRLISKLFVLKNNCKVSTLKFWQIFITILVFIGAIVYRCLALTNSNAIVLTDTSCFNAVTQNIQNDTEIMLLSVHSGTYIYMSILDVFMQFLGTRPVAVVFLQIIIQVISIVLAFFAGKRLFNFTTGLVSATFLAVIPFYYDKIFEANAGCFLGFIFILGLLLISFVRNLSGAAKVIYSIILGIMLGLFVYMDIYESVLVVPLFVALWYDIGNAKTVSGSRVVNTVVAFVLSLIMAVLSLVLFLAVDGGFVYEGFEVALNTWIKVSNTNLVPEYTLLDMGSGLTGLIICMICIAIGGFTVLGSFANKQIEFELGWLLMFCVALTPLVKVGYLQDNTFAIIVYAFLIGLGIAAMRYIAPDPEDDSEDMTEIEIEEEAEPRETEAIKDGELQDEVEQTKESQINVTHTNEPQTDGVQDVAEEDDDIHTSKAQEDVTEENEPEEELISSISWEEIKALDAENEDNDVLDEIAEELAEAAEEIGAAEEMESEEAVEATEEEEVQVVEVAESAEEIEANEETEPTVDLKQVDDLPGMIPNPLPLPTRRPHMAMDFAIEVTEEDMHFDIEIEDDDDFDV